jgi:uncharacterized protein (TIGR03437 family)
MRSVRTFFYIAGTVLILTLGSSRLARTQQQTSGTDGPPPDILPYRFQHVVGDATAGRDIFRYETFGNQGFWTDALQLPQGIAAAKLTPIQALQLGLNINVDALNDGTKSALAAAIKQVQSGIPLVATILNDPTITLQLINQNAVMGVVVFDPQGNRKPLGGVGFLNIAGGDKVGLTCAVCHGITDNSVLPPLAALGTRGSVGHELDGPANHGLDVGTIIAAGQRSLAYYPMLQLQFKALKNATIGRGDFPGLLTTPTTLPTEAQADAYLTGTSANGQRYYPVGQFDAFPDGIGNPTHIMPFFRADLSAPWGMDGGDDKLDDFNNTVYTVSLDPTSLLTGGGRKLLNVLAGPVGDEIANDYEQVLKGIGVIPAGKNTLDVVPFVKAQDGLAAGTPGSLAGRRVDNTKLLNLNAYLNTLQPPPLGQFDATLAARGRDLFRTNASAGGAGCTACHQIDPNKFVPYFIIPIKALYPAYSPTVIFQRPAPLSPIQKSFGGPSPFYDNRLVVVDASVKGDVRGYALPMKLDLARRTSLLHDDEIVGATFDEAADIMMNSAKRDPKAAHPFFVASADDRKAIIEFMKSLTTSGPTFTSASVANAASLRNGPIAPGELITISTSALGLNLASATVDNVIVTFDGTRAVPIFVFPTLITVVAPFELAGKSTTQFQVTASGQKSAIVTLSIADTAPGLYTADFTGLGGLAAINQDGTFNSAKNPAPAGSVVSLFATGGGKLQASFSNGQVVSGTPLLVATASATIDNQAAQVLYAGGVPNLVSSSVQINVVVPLAARSGNLPIVVNIGGVVSQSDVTIAVK